MHNRKQGLSVLSLAAVITFFSGTAQTELTANISGNIVEQGCDLEEASGDIQVNFGKVVNQYLYQNTRTPAMPFVLNLVNCKEGTPVELRFSGTASTALPGMLDAGKAGLVIGLETSRGGAIPINAKVGAFVMKEGNNPIALQAYLQASPAAVQTRSIRPGEFYATATFTVQYE